MTRVLVAILATLAVLIAAAFLFDRGYPLTDPDVPLVDPGTVEVDLAQSEARFDDLKPDAAARIIWAREPGAATERVILYLHGFSATSREIRPVPDKVAAALDANLVLWRLPGHGRSGAAMAEPRPQDWLDSTAQAIATARAVGDRVTVIGTSTGGTLAARAAAAPGLATLIDGIVFVSPNFRLVNPQEPILTLPLAGLWLPLVAGAERGFEPRSPEHAASWTMRYPTIAVHRLAWLMRRVRGLDFAAISQPALFLFSDADMVVDARETRRVAAEWGGAVKLSPQTLGPGDDPESHVLAGDILSPGMTDRVSAEIVEWVNSNR